MARETELGQLDSYCLLSNEKSHDFPIAGFDPDSDFDFESDLDGLPQQFYCGERVHTNVVNLSSIARYGVIPAKAGIQSFYAILDPGFRRGDGANNHFSLKFMTLGCTPCTKTTGMVHGVHPTFQPT